MNKNKHMIIYLLLQILTLTFAPRADSAELYSILSNIKSGNEQIKSGKIELTLMVHKMAKVSDKEIEQTVESERKRLEMLLEQTLTEPERTNILYDLEIVSTQIKQELGEVRYKNKQTIYFEDQKFRQDLKSLSYFALETHPRVSHNYDCRHAFDGVKSVEIDTINKIARINRERFADNVFGWFGREESFPFLKVERITIIGEEDIGGLKHYVLEYKDECIQKKIWVCPDRQFTISRCETMQECENISVREETFSNFKIINQIWYPMNIDEVRYSVIQGQRNIAEERTYTVNYIELNNNVPDEVFYLGIPPDYMIIDRSISIPPIIIKPTM